MVVVVRSSGVETGELPADAAGVYLTEPPCRCLADISTFDLKSYSKTTDGVDLQSILNRNVYRMTTHVATHDNPCTYATVSEYDSTSPFPVQAYGVVGERGGDIGHARASARAAGRADRTGYIYMHPLFCCVLPRDGFARSAARACAQLYLSCKMSHSVHKYYTNVLLVLARCGYCVSAVGFNCRAAGQRAARCPHT